MNEHKEEQKRQKRAKAKRQLESDALDAEIEDAAMAGVIDMSHDDAPPEGEGQQSSGGNRKRARRVTETDSLGGALAIYLKEQSTREDRRLELEAKQIESEAKRVDNENKTHALMEKMLALLSKQSAE